MDGGTDAESFRLSLDEIGFIGNDLARPECVLATVAGDLYASDKRGGVMHLAPDGTQRLIPGDPKLIPNGIALLPDGSFAVANLSDDGGLWRIAREGGATPLLLEAEGQRLPSVNFVWLDAEHRLWISISTVRPGDHQFRGDIADGFLILLDGKGARIVADRIGWTNEVRIDAAGRYLYLAETFGRRLTRFPLKPGGSLGQRETVVQFGEGMFPDGLAIDAEGGIWVIGVGVNRIARVMPDGRQQLVVADCDPAHVARLEAAYAAKTLGRPLLYQVHSRVLPNVTSLAFGGPDLRTAYLGSVAGTAIATFRSPVAGLPPPHWHF